MSCPLPLSCYCRLICSCGLSPRDPDDSMETPTWSNRQYKNYTVYVLLLGAAETGKSTMMRQMKIIHSGGMSPASLRLYTRHILGNVLKCLKKLILAVQRGAVWGSPEAAHAANVLGEVTGYEWGLDEEDVKPAIIPQDHAHLMQVLWNDGAAQECWQRANEFELPDNTAYYLDATERLAQQPYVPIQDDVLQLRIPTKSETVYDFTDRNWIFRITDVGGQRGERRRWLRLFDNINAIIFLAALSEYDQTWSQEEEEGMNRLELSLQLFRETIEYRGFVGTCIILFLNKTDVLKKKIATSDLNRYFPDYTGPRRDAKSATNYIRERFFSIAEECPDLEKVRDRTDIFTHETCATDTDATRFVFAAVREKILFDNLRRLDLLM